MLISVTDWVALLGMSRETYYSYKRGDSAPSKGREERLRKLLRELVSLVTLSGWPTTPALIARGKDRLSLLNEELEKLRQESVRQGE